MRIIEISSKNVKSGEKHFRAALFKIQPDSCLVDLTGTQYNLNGITWIKEYCESNLQTGIGKSITVEFVDEERTEISGHGDTGVEDGVPIFNNATVIGHFTNIYIGEIELDGELCTVCIGEGTLDYMRYKPFLDILEHRLNAGETIYGSVEIMGKPENNNEIVYLDGWKEKGRVPKDFIISGWAILDILPSDNKSQILELNQKEQKQNKEDILKMDEKMLQTFVSDIKQVVVETNSKNEELSKSITELNTAIAEKDNLIAELNTSSEELKTALEKAQEDYQEIWKKEDELYNEIKELKAQLAEAQAKERVGEMNSAIADFTDEEKAYAENEIKAFEADPVNSEINSVIDKIWAEIGKKAKETEKIISEQNAANTNVEVDDIFAEVVETNSLNNDDDSIF